MNNATQEGWMRRKRATILASAIFSLGLLITILSALADLMALKGAQGSNIHLAGAIGVAFVLGGIGYFVLGSERSRLLRLASGTHSTDDFDIWRERADLNARIEDLVGKAEREITFIGGLSEDFLTQTFRDRFVSRMEEARTHVNVTLVYESDQVTFSRALYLGNPQLHVDVRMQGDLAKKHERKLALRSDLIRRAKNPSAVEKQLHVMESHLPLYMTIIKIDDEMFVTPVTDRRGSHTPTIRLRYRQDTDDPIRLMAQRYLAYFVDSQGRRGTAAPMLQEVTGRIEDDERIPLLDMNGKVQAYGPRDVQREYYERTNAINTDMAVTVPVVYGLIFAPDGRVLRSLRSAEAHDNHELWDKSFGGHRTDRDGTREQALGREFAEELELTHIRFTHLGEYNDDVYARAHEAGRWEGIRLFQDQHRISRRQRRNGSTWPAEVRADCYFIICPDPAIVPAKTTALAELRWSAVEEWRRDIKQDSKSFTQDVQWLQECYGDEIEHFSTWLANQS